MILGVLGISKCPNRIGEKLSEAFLIAGFLSLSVDWWLKRKLQEDAAKDIFQHLLGINLPPELRTKIQRFVEENCIYRTNVIIRVRVEDKIDGVMLYVEMDAENRAAKEDTYQQNLTFEEALQGEPIRALLRSQTSDRSYYSFVGSEMHLREKPDEPQVLQWQGRSVHLRPGDAVKSYVSFSVKRSRRDFYVIFFGRSTINPILQVTGSDTLSISASTEDATITGIEYAYRKVFLRGDHIQVRWKPKSNPDVKAC